MPNITNKDHFTKFPIADLMKIDQLTDPKRLHQIAELVRQSNDSLEQLLRSLRKMAAENAEAAKLARGEG